MVILCLIGPTEARIKLLSGISWLPGRCKVSTWFVVCEIAYSLFMLFFLCSFFFFFWGGISFFLSFYFFFLCKQITGSLLRVKFHCTLSASSALFSSNKKIKKPKRSHPTECRVERDGSERTESIRLIVSNRRKKSQERVHTLGIPSFCGNYGRVRRRNTLYCCVASNYNYVGVISWQTAFTRSFWSLFASSFFLSFLFFSIHWTRVSRSLSLSLLFSFIKCMTLLRIIVTI